MSYSTYIGKNWFELRDTINAKAAGDGLSTNLKVKGDVIEGSNIPLKDFTDIMAGGDRLTITIEPKGKILTIKRG